MTFFKSVIILLLLLFTNSNVYAASEEEIQILNELYDSTNGDNWFENENWKIGDPCGFGEEQEGKWARIYCDEEGSITEIDMFNNNLSGSLPESLQNLSNLKILVVATNEQLGGQIPDFIGNMVGLEFLHLYLNNYTGEIPKSFANLVNLQDFRIQENYLSGEFPSFIQNFTQLTALDLSRNNFSGELPDIFDNLTLLFELHLSFNNFAGPIPQSLGNLPELTTLNLEGNLFCGSLPKWNFNIPYYVYYESACEIPTTTTTENEALNTSTQTDTSTQTVNLDSVKKISKTISDSTEMTIIISASLASVALISISGFAYLRIKSRQSKYKPQDFSTLESNLGSNTLGKSNANIFKLLLESDKMKTSELLSTVSTNFNTQDGTNVTLSSIRPNNYAIAAPGHCKMEIEGLVYTKQIASGGMAKIYEIESFNDTKKLEEWKKKLYIDKESDLLIKILKKDLGFEINRFKFEVSVMDAVQRFTENSVKLLGWSDKPAAIIMKKYHSSLDQYLFKNNKLRNEKLKLLNIRRMLCDISNALNVLEQLGVVHNDIKPHNVLILTDGINTRCFLNDYGCAQLFVDRKLLKADFNTAVDGITPYYTAPEILSLHLKKSTSSPDSEKTMKSSLNGSDPTSEIKNANLNKSDVYSFAILAFEILFQQRAWLSCLTTDDIIQKVCNGERPEVSEELINFYNQENPELFKLLYEDIIKKCWDQDSSQRPSFGIINGMLHQS